MRTVYAQKNKKIILGRQGEDKAVRVVWPGIVSDWSSLYGDGSFQLSVRRFGDENSYPIVVEVNGDDVRFTVTSAETSIAGNGRCELTYIANGTVAKSATWETVVLNSLTGQEPSEPPEEPAQSWFTSIQGQIGNLADLATSSKDNLVAAINEAAQSGGGGGSAVELDTTLTQSGKAADAKAVGDAIRSLSEEMLTEESDPTVPEWAKAPEKPSYTASEVGADPSGTAESQVSTHNTGTDTHSDIRLLIQGLSERLSAVADSDDTALDQLSEIVAYIKYNRGLIDAITTSKVSVADIIDNLTTNVANKPLSAAQGVALKALIDAITIPEVLPNPNALTFTGAVTGSYDGSEPVTVEIPRGGGGGSEVTPELLYSGTAENVSAFQQNIDMKGHKRFCVIVGGTKGESAISINEGNFYLYGKRYKIFYYTNWLSATSASYTVGCVTEHFTFVDDDKIAITYQQSNTSLDGIVFGGFQGSSSSIVAPKLSLLQGYDATNEDGIALSFSSVVESVTVYVFGY